MKRKINNNKFSFMNKKPLLILVVISVFAAIVFMVYVQKIENSYIFAPEERLADDAQNATYTIEGEKVTLADGKAERETVPGSALKVITQYFGNEARGDFNGDGSEDIVFLLSQDTGGSGTFYYVAVALKLQNGYKGTNAVILGDRIAPQTTEFRDGKIIVNYAERKPGEAMTESPSVGVSKYFKVDNDILIEL